MRSKGQPRLAAGIVASFFLAAMPAIAADPVVIGVAGPFTGQLAAFGEQERRGVTMAVEDINARGGIAGRKLQLETGDDLCDPRQAVAAANYLVGKKAIFVVGHLCSGSSIPASAVYHEGGVIMMSPAATAPAMTDEPAKKGWKNIFRVTGRDDTQGGLAGGLIAKRYGDKKIALIHDKSAYGKGLADEARKALAKAGIREALYDSVTAGEKDFSALISKLKRDGIEVIYYGGYHTEAAQIVRQAHDQGLRAQFIGADALTTTELWSIAGNTAEGLLFTFIADPRNSPGAAQTIARFRAAGYEPEGYTLTAYATVEALAGAAALAGTTAFDPLQAALRKGSFDTVLGPIAFDEKGDMKDPRFVFYRWSDGKYAEAADLK